MSRGLARRLPSPALAVALAALFVALAGTSYAAFALAPGSVGTAQLKNGAVTGPKFAPGATAPQARFAFDAGKLDLVTVEHLHYTDDPGLAAGAQLPCPPGQTAISGGIRNSQPEVEVYVDAPYSTSHGFGPGGQPNAWEFDTFNSSATADNVEVWTMCAFARAVTGF